MDTFIQPGAQTAVILDGTPNNYQTETRRKANYIKVRILDINYTLEILKITQVIRNANVMKYLHSAQCGLVKHDGKTYLAFDTRKDKEKLIEKKANVIIAEARRNNITIPLGFIVKNNDDFFAQLF